MSLIICTECGKEFSDKAPACPNCGCPTSEILNEVEKEPEDSAEEASLNLNLYLSYKKYEIRAYDNNLQVIQNSVIISDDDISNYVLLWALTKKVIGVDQTEIVFTHKKFSKPLQLVLVRNKNTENSYNQLLEFKQICEFHMQQNIQKSSFHAYSYQIPKTAEEVQEAARRKCPKCGSDNITYQVQELSKFTSKTGNTSARKAGRKALTVATFGMWGLTAKPNGNEHTHVINGTFAICQNCGNSWRI